MTHEQAYQRALAVFKAAEAGKPNPHPDDEIAVRLYERARGK